MNRVAVEELKCSGQVLQAFNLRSFQDIVHKVRFITIGSTKFSSNHSVVLCPATGIIPAYFGLIVNIIVHDNRHLFLCKMYRVSHFDPHVNAFCVVRRKDGFHQAVLPSQLVEFRTYSLHTPGFVTPEGVQNKKYIISKTNISELVLHIENC